MQVFSAILDTFLPFFTTNYFILYQAWIKRHTWQYVHRQRKCHIFSNVSFVEKGTMFIAYLGAHLHCHKAGTGGNTKKSTES